MQTSHLSPTVLSYATSLLELADEQGQLQPVGEELNGVGEVLDGSPTFGEYLADPGISAEAREKVLTDVFAGKLSKLTFNFLGVLNVKGRLKLLREIVAAFDDLMDQKLGKVEVDVTVAQRLSADDLEQVRQKVGKALGKDAVVHQYVDESLIGGMVLRVGDRLVDGSVKTQLQNIRKRILSAQPK